MFSTQGRSLISAALAGHVSRIGGAILLKTNYAAPFLAAGERIHGLVAGGPRDLDEKPFFSRLFLVAGAVSARSPHAANKVLRGSSCLT